MKKRMLVSAMALGLAATAGAGSAFAKDAGERVWIGFHEGQQVSLQRSLQREGAEVHFEFNEIGAVVATLSTEAINRLKASGSVKYIEPDQKYYPMGGIVPYGIDLVQARDVWDADRDGTIDADAPTGEGVTVCVIDSGLTAGHQDFANVDVIGGFPEGWDNDRCGHGTHVAGTIAADLNAQGVVGVSPGAVSLYIVKVFGNSTDASCEYTFSSSVVAAAQICADEGAKIINMSLGGGAPTEAAASAFQALRDQGVLSVAAAGNSGNTSLLYPASYPAVVSVGGVDSAKNHYTASQRNSQVELAAPGVGVLSTVGYSAADLSVAGVGYMVGAMTGTTQATASGDLAQGGQCLEPLSGVGGKIVLCERGVNPFSEKASNAVAGGAAGVVVYNNVAGGFSGTLGDVSIPVPVLSLSQADGQALVSGSLGMSASVSTIFTYPANGYDTYSGTSMATPHVAGAAAVAWSEDPDLTLTQVLNALIAGAEDLGAPGRDNLFGHGLIQLADTIEIIRSGEIPEPPAPPPPPPPPSSQALVNGVLVNLAQISGGEWARYYIDVPAGAENLVLELRPLAGTTGDGDLHVRFGAEPSLTQYDCRPWLLGNDETCTIDEPQEGRYYVWVNAFGTTAVTNVSLEASFEGGIDPDAPIELINGELVELPPIAADEWAHYYIDLPEGNRNGYFEIDELAGTTGDADIYVRLGAQPTLDDYDCRPYALGSVERCAAADGGELPAGRWFVSVHAFPLDGEVTNVSLEAGYEIAGLGPSNLTGTTSGARMRPMHNLSWDGGEDQVDVWRNGTVVHTGANTGEFSLQMPAASGTSTWQVCNAGTEECTGEVQLR